MVFSTTAFRPRHADGPPPDGCKQPCDRVVYRFRVANHIDKRFLNRVFRKTAPTARIERKDAAVTFPQHFDIVGRQPAAGKRHGNPLVAHNRPGGRDFAHSSSTCRQTGPVFPQKPAKTGQRRGDPLLAGWCRVHDIRRQVTRYPQTVQSAGRMPFLLCKRHENREWQRAGRASRSLHGWKRTDAEDAEEKARKESLRLRVSNESAWANQHPKRQRWSRNRGPSFKTAIRSASSGRRRSASRRDRYRFRCVRHRCRCRW